MITKNIHKALITIFLVLSVANIGIAQKIKIDTVYHNRSGQVVSQESDYWTYEVRQLDRKKRVNGKVERYTKSGQLAELTRYVKGEKEGTYYQYNEAEEVIIYGAHENSLKTGFWLFLDDNGSLIMTEEYDDSGKLIEKQDKSSLGNANTSLVKLESRANFFGGDEGWSLHLRNNLKYPQDAKRAGYQGHVFMAFTVLSNGKITDLRAINSPHEILTKEALRMIETSPDWLPAMIDGKPVDSQVIRRLEFRLK